MNCEQIEVWISAHQDGELDVRRQRQVEDHLVTCAGCRELAAALSAVERTLRSELVRFDAPETLHTRVMRQIPEPAAAPMGRRGSWTLGGWFTFGLVPAGAAAAWMLLTANPGGSPQPPSAVPQPPKVTSGAVPTPSPVPNAGPKVKTATAALPENNKPGVSRNSVGAGERQRAEPKGQKAQPSGPDRGIRQKYDPLHRLRGLRPRRKSYRLVDRPHRPTRRPRWQRDLRRDEPLRMVEKVEPPKSQESTPETPEQPMRTAQMPRVSVVDYVLPRVPSTALAPDGSDPQFVLRSAQAQEVAQGGYEF